MTDDDSRFDKYVIGGLASYLQREGNNAFIAIIGGRMHEITLCQHAMEIMQQQARQNNAQRITAVWFEIGAFSCVEAESLRFCFDMVCRDTLAEGCELHLAEQKAQCWCHDCQSDVELLIPQVLVCPRCSGRNLRVEADDGLKIKRLEIE